MPARILLLAHSAAMLPRPRLFVKKRGKRRTGARWAGQVVEGLLFAALIAVGAYGLYWLVERITSHEAPGIWPWFAMVIPLAVIIYAAAGLIRLVWQSVASTERRAVAVRKATGWELPGIDIRSNRPSLPNVPPADAVSDSPGVRLAFRLPIDAASGWVSFMMAGVCIAWNTLVAMFIVQVIQMPSDDRAKWLLMWLMVPFASAGIWTLYELARQVLLNIAVGTTRVEISTHPLRPGGIYRAFVSQTGRLHVRWLQAQLVCEEQAIHQQGTDTRRAVCRVYRATLFSRRKFDITPREPFEAEFDVAVPDSAMHSFVSSHNAVIWSLTVRGRMARWGDFERRFPIYVYPKAVEKPTVAAPQFAVSQS
jgi:hypothetical protein